MTTTSTELTPAADPAPDVLAPKFIDGKILGVAARKGGVGKTSLLTGIAQSIALRRDTRVLVIDACPQASWRCDFLPGDFDDSDLGVRLLKGEPLTPKSAGRPNLDAVFGGATFLLGLEASRDNQMINLLRSALEPIIDDYDLVLIDAPPVDQTVFLNCLAACDGLIVPLNPDKAAMRGIALDQMQAQVARQGEKPAQVIAGVPMAVDTSNPESRYEWESCLAEASQWLESQSRTDGDQWFPTVVTETHIPYLPDIARICRKEGLAAHELKFYGKTRGRFSRYAPGTVSAKNAERWSAAYDQLTAELATMFPALASPPSN